MNDQFYLVKALLERADQFDWSLQGFGMLRTYLAPELRLHIWDSQYAVENVTQMHTHPWDFRSTVVAGAVKNTRYVKSSIHLPSPSARFREQEILCGPGGHETDKTASIVRLYEQPWEYHVAGDSYIQAAEEIHKSEPEDGTVTLVRRVFKEDADHAYVYIPEGEEWVSAEPRVATPEEVDYIVDRALARWFNAPASIEEEVPS